jgi:hypothetical protein
MDLDDSMMLIGRGRDGFSQSVQEKASWHGKSFYQRCSARESMSHQGRRLSALTCSEIACYGFRRSAAVDGPALPCVGWPGTSAVFQNRERRLPRGRYKEYDVNRKVPGRSRDAERLVIEQDTGKAYYTDDHYRTFFPLN